LNTASTNDSDKSIPQAKLKEVLDKELAILGRPIQDIVYEQLSRCNISFSKNNGTAYTLRQLQNGLEELLGNEAAVLLIERLFSTLFSEGNKSET